MKTDDSCITKPKKGMKDNTITVLTKYNDKGTTNAKLADENVAATQLNINNKMTYKIKVNKYGKAYDPLNHALNAKSPITKEAVFKLRIVNRKCFDLYILFLQKRAANLLVSAEREM